MVLGEIEVTEVEKVSIYAPSEVVESLDRDARLFEVFKKDGKTINRNRFLSMLIVGYHESYSQELWRKRSAIQHVLEGTSLGNFEANAVAEEILGAVAMEPRKRSVGKRMTRISLKPTKRTEMVVRNIQDSLGPSTTLSQYLCSMLESYVHLPSAERERTIFKETLELLLDACESGRKIAFTTIWDSEVVHRATPYSVSVGQNETFNYLLCGEEGNGEQRARTFRLNRIADVVVADRPGTLDKDVARHLSMMVANGAQYAINCDDVAVVKLTEKGLRAYQRIYLGRPQYSEREQVDNNCILRFKCSEDQLFLYFSKFGPGEAEIIAPKSLRERVISFHHGALKMYDSSSSNASN